MVDCQKALKESENDLGKAVDILRKKGIAKAAKRTKQDLIYWAIPGRGVEETETRENALTRECKEELGVDVRIGNLILELDSEKPETIGQTEYFYLTNIIGGKIGSGKGPEFQRDSIYIGEYDIEWKDINSLDNINLKPKKIIRRKSQERLYCGGNEKDDSCYLRSLKKTKPLYL